MLLGAGVVLTTLYAAGAFLPRHPEYDFFFGVEAFEPFGVVTWLVSCGVALALLARPDAATAAGAALGRLAVRIPFRRSLLVYGTAVAFYALTNVRLSGDASAAIITVGTGRVLPSNALTSYLHLLVDAIPGLDAYDAIRAVSVVSGIAYVPVALALGRACFRDGARRTALTVLLLTVAPVTLFFGSMEVYAPLVTALALYLLVGIRYLRGTGSGLWPPLVASIAFCLHGSAGLLLPSLLLLANGGRLRPVLFRRWLLWGVLWLTPVLAVGATVVFGTWGGEAPTSETYRYGSFVGGMGQGPILPLVRTADNLMNRYAMLDLEHLIGVLNLWVMAAPIGLILIAVGRPRRGGAVFRWIAVVAAFLAVFPLFWNVNYELRRDWDLFSPVAVPLALLGGLAFLRMGGGRRRAAGIVALALLSFVPLVIGNLGSRHRQSMYAGTVWSAFRYAEGLSEGARRVENSRAEEEWRNRALEMDTTGRLVGRANALAAGKRLEEAIPLYRRILEIEPENDTARTNLGIALWTLGRKIEARETLEEAVRVTPYSFQARMNLAKSYVQENRLDEAIPYLERTVRYASIDDRVLQAVELLERIWREKGDRERADAMRRLAEERIALRRR
jgi:tetratricopeptide (TPR) repeat protein